MGGNAFKQLDLVRVKREDLPATVQHVVDTLNLTGFTYNYAMDSLMGSSGKKATSGDVDFCMNTHVARFVGEPELPVFDKHEVVDRLYEVMPGTNNHPSGGRHNPYVNTQTLKMGNLMSAWPVAGDHSNGLVQVDFVFGKRDLLLFTHFSPGDESEFKGVFVSQAYGVLAKMQKNWETRDLVTYERTGRVGLHLSLELGLFRKWESRRRPGMGCSKTTANEFETRFADAPRFTRLGYVDDPEAILAILFGPGTKHEDVNTFEKVVKHVREKMPDRYGEFWERFCQSAGGSSIAKQNAYDVFEMVVHPIWDAKNWQDQAFK